MTRAGLGQWHRMDLKDSEEHASGLGKLSGIGS